MQEVSVQKEPLRLGPYADAALFEDDSIRKSIRSLDSAFNLDSADGHIEGSNEDEASFNLYAYGAVLDLRVNCLASH